jgi:hypothetical protein
MSAFPSLASSVGWIDETNPYADITVNSDYTFELDLNAYAISCEMAYSKVCKNFLLPATEDLCADMGWCLTGDSSWPDNYLGMVGLGKWDVNDTESSYMMQMYLENGLKPEINIDLNFDGQISHIVTTESLQFPLGSVTSYSASDEWAFQIASWSWAGKAFTPHEEGCSDIALLQTGTLWLEVPSSLYIDISYEMVRFGWECTRGYSTPADNYCFIDQPCADFIQEFPELSFNFNEAIDDTTTQTFTVNIFPEVYLE